MTDLDALVTQALDSARSSSARRHAVTVVGGPGRRLRQTLLALPAGAVLADHESPGEATLQVLRGRVRLTSGDDAWEVEAGQLVEIPPARHGLAALSDAVVLLTVAA